MWHTFTRETRGGCGKRRTNGRRVQDEHADYTGHIGYLEQDEHVDFAGDIEYLEQDEHVDFAGDIGYLEQVGYVKLMEKVKQFMIVCCKNSVTNSRRYK